MRNLREAFWKEITPGTSVHEPMRHHLRRAPWAERIRAKNPDAAIKRKTITKTA